MDIKIHYKIEKIEYHFFGNTYLHHHIIVDIVPFFSW